jgi:hypothetical protein
MLFIVTTKYGGISNGENFLCNPKKTQYFDTISKEKNIWGMRGGFNFLIHWLSVKS